MFDQAIANNVIEIFIPSNLDPIPIRWRMLRGVLARRASRRRGEKAAEELSAPVAGRPPCAERGRRAGLARWASRRRGEKELAAAAGRRSCAERVRRAGRSHHLLTLVIDEEN